MQLALNEFSISARYNRNTGSGGKKDGMTIAWKSSVAGCVLLLATLGPAGLVQAQGNPNGTNQNGTTQNGTTQNGTGQNVNVAATPELDSLALFGAGAVGVAGYALRRLRASRRQPESD